MPDARLTDDHELVQRNASLARGALALAAMLTQDPSDLGVAVISADSVWLAR